MTNELEALRARVKELEAKQPAAPTSGLGQVFGIVQAVASIVPRWLLVAAGVIFLAWLGFDLYTNVILRMADVETRTTSPNLTSRDRERVRELVKKQCMDGPDKFDPEWRKLFHFGVLKQCEQMKNEISLNSEVSRMIDEMNSAEKRMEEIRMELAKEKLKGQ